MKVVAGISAVLLLPVCMNAVRKTDKSAGSHQAGACGFTTDPVENDIGNGERSFAWTEPYRADLFADGLLLEDAAWQDYVSWLGNTVPRNWGVDPFDQKALLRRQRDIFVKHNFPGHQFDVILDGSVGGLYDANCIESALVAKQNELHPLKVSATEFGAYILLDSANTTVKVYMQTGPNPWVTSMSWAFPSIHQDISDGFQVLTFLHQHPFFAQRFSSRSQDIAGTAIPSGPDLRSFASHLASFGQKEAWITNGHDSFRFPLSQLGVFDEGAALAEGPLSEFNFGDRPEVITEEPHN